MVSVHISCQPSAHWRSTRSAGPGAWLANALNAPALRQLSQIIWYHLSMNKRSFFVTLVVAELIGYGSRGLAGAVVVGVIAFAGYAVSVRLHPRVRHRGCNGTGEIKGRIFGWTFRRCPNCDGGRMLRAGNAVAGSSRYAGLYRARRAARARARREGSHR
jgi:hypothetical protein